MWCSEYAGISGSRRQIFQVFLTFYTEFLLPSALNGGSWQESAVAVGVVTSLLYWAKDSFINLDQDLFKTVQISG